MSLTEMRKNSGSFVTYLLFAMIIIVFVFTFNTIGPAEACGGAQGPAGPNQELAEIGDTSVDTNRLALAEALIITPPTPRQKSNRALQRDFLYRATRYYFSPLRRSVFADFGADAFEYTPIKIEKAMNTLQETLLVSAEAEKMGLSVSNAELRERLSGAQAFTDPKTGRFSVKRWEDWVRRSRTTPTRMEDFLKKELLREKLVALVVSGVTVSDAELAYLHRTTKEKVNLEYVAIDDNAALPLLAAPEAEVKTWLQANQDKVKADYEKNKAEYNKDERVIFRGIQFRAPNKAVLASIKDEQARKSMTSQRDAARGRASAALAALNKQAAEDTKKKAEDTKKKAEDTKKKAEDTKKKAEEAPKAAPSKPAITEAIFAAVAKEQSDNENKVNGGLFDKGYDRAQLSKTPFGTEISTVAFELKNGETSGVIEVNNGFWIIHKVRTLAAEKKELAQVEMEIATRLFRKEKVGNFTESLAKDVLAEAQKDPKKKLDDVLSAINAKYKAEEDGLSSDETGLFARVASRGAPGGRIPGIGVLTELSGAAFAASADKPLLGKVYTSEDKKKHYVARFLAREDAGDTNLEDMKTTREDMIRERQRWAYTAWLKELIAAARASGEITESNNWATLVNTYRRQYRESGGSLGGPAAAAAAGLPTIPAP